MKLFRILHAREPLWVRVAVGAVLILLVELGMPVSDHAASAIQTLAEIFIGALAVQWARAGVSPKGKVEIARNLPPSASMRLVDAKFKDSIKE